LKHLRDIDAPSRLGGHVWLNADVIAGPGALMSPIDARRFVRTCSEILPEAVLSLSWGSSMLSTSRQYTEEMVECMVEICMTPFVPAVKPKEAQTRPSGEEPTAAAASTDNNGSADNSIRKYSAADGDLYVTPAAICNHITFAVAAEYALSSTDA